MYNVHLSWFPSQIKLTIIRGALITKERERERERERGREEGLNWSGRREEGWSGWMDGSMHSPDPMQVAIPVLLIISASPTNNTPPPHTH
jgi:hypothetical protein